MNPDQNNPLNNSPVPPAPTASTPPDTTSGQTVRYIAVDANGVPLPQQAANLQPSQPSQPAAAEGSASQPQQVYMSRPMEMPKPAISAAVQQKHDESVKQYPYLNLSEGEYVIIHVTHHPIGLVSIWGFVGILVLIMLGVLVAFGAFGQNFAQSFGIDTANMPSLGVFSIPIALLVIMFLIGGYVASIVYSANKFFLTNESVIQEIQTNLFNKREQTVSLGNIEDASYTQHGIIPMLLNYGSIRLSTQGDETTYRFNYVSDPKQQIAYLNNAVESFKNGRPVHY